MSHTHGRGKTTGIEMSTFCRRRMQAQLPINRLPGKHLRVRILLVNLLHCSLLRFLGRPLATPSFPLGPSYRPTLQQSQPQPAAQLLKLTHQRSALSLSLAPVM